MRARSVAAVIAVAMTALVAPSAGAAPPPPAPTFEASSEAEVGADVVPSITIVQDSIADSPQDFAFTGCSTTICGTFRLDDDDDAALPNSGIAEGLTPGTYTVTQSPTDRWTLTDLTCTTGETVDLANRRVTIDLAAGEAVICTFTTRSPSITIRLAGHVNGEQDFDFTGCLGAGCGRFALDRDDDADLPPTISGAGLVPGTYTVTQDAVTNWFTSLTCDTGGTTSHALRQATITLDATRHTTCTFTQDTRSIHIHQRTGSPPNPEPQAFTYQGCFEDGGCRPFTLGANGAAPNRIAAYGLDHGRYTITQDPPVEGYSRPDISCSFAQNVEIDAFNRTVTLDLWEIPPGHPYGNGSNFSCTFTNRAVGPPLDDVVQISAGSSTCARLAAGEARCWGVLPGSPSEGFTAITDLSYGGGHLCAVLADGRARCRGHNGSGQLGLGTTTTTGGDGIVSNPAGDGPLTGVTQIEAGSEHTCATLVDRRAYCWGANGGGRLGDGTTTARSRPVPVLAPEGSGVLEQVASVSAGATHTCAALTTGEARCWGTGTSRALGDGTAINRSRPVAVRNETNTGPLIGVTQISAGSTKTCAVIADTSARCWGTGLPGGGDSNVAPLPVAVWNDDRTGAMLGVTAISAGGNHACLVLETGQARCWGRGEDGQLGDGTTGGSDRPMVVRATTGSGPLTDVASIAAGTAHTCAALTDGQARCWGRTGMGQGDSMGSTLPVPVLTPR